MPFVHPSLELGYHECPFLVLGLDLGPVTAARSGVSTARGVHALNGLTLLGRGGGGGLVAALEGC